MVEKFIHQIWVGDFKIPHREQELHRKMKSLHPDYEYSLWRDDDIKLEYDNFPHEMKYWYDVFYQNKNYVFCADLLRVYLVYTYGGFYLDIDFDVKERLDPFFMQDVLFHHNDGDFTIPNNLFCFKKESPVLKYCLSSINRENSWYGPSWFGKTIKDFLGLPYESLHSVVQQSLLQHNVNYYQYYEFETQYARHQSLYSWEPKTWERMRKGEQL